jgi:ABC-type nitrate/sulfonate/bicarbonate transport system permease component
MRLYDFERNLGVHWKHYEMHRTTLEPKSLFAGWAVLLVTWSASSYLLKAPEYVLASPHSVLLYLTENTQRFSAMLALTATQAYLGWSVGVVLGAALGTLAYFIPWGRRFLLAPLLALQTTPIIALAPLITFWFGYSWFAKVVVVAIVSMLPIVFAVYSGLGDARPSHLHLLKLAGASEFSIFWRVRLPGAWTSVLSSLKVAIMLAVIGSIVADFMGGDSGLGFLIMKAIYGSKGDVLIASILGAALVGQLGLITLELALSRWEERFDSGS